MNGSKKILTCWMAFRSESTCWFSSLILSSLAVPLLFCPETFTSGSVWETWLIGISYIWKKRHRVCPFTSRQLKINVKWSVSPLCTSAAPVVCCLISADSQSADLVEVSPKTLSVKVHVTCEINECCVSTAKAEQDDDEILHRGLLSWWRGSYLPSLPAVWCKNPWPFPPWFPSAFWGERSAPTLQEQKESYYNLLRFYNWTIDPSALTFDLTHH